MSARKTLYLLRRPIVDPNESLLPPVSTTSSSNIFSLVLLEEAVSSSPSFPGQVYVLQSSSKNPIEPHNGEGISQRDLVALIAEHDVTIVL